MPRSALMITSVSVTSTVPLIGVLSIAIFAESSKFSTEPCQFFSFTASCTGMPAFGRDISSNDRSMVCITSALVRLCAIVIFIRFRDLRYYAARLLFFCPYAHNSIPRSRARHQPGHAASCFSQRRHFGPQSLMAAGPVSFFCIAVRLKRRLPGGNQTLHLRDKELTRR